MFHGKKAILIGQVDETALEVIPFSMGLKLLCD